MDSDSIRVDGVGNAVIFDVVYHPPAAADPETKKREVNASLKAVEDKLRTLNKDKDIRDDQEAFLGKYAGTINAEKYDGKSMLDFLDSYWERKRSIFQDIEALKAQIKDLEKEAKELRKDLKQDSASLKRRVKVSVVALAANDGKARLVLSYSKHTSFEF